ncbi:MAG: hypothetical protein OXI10_08595, partial [Gammaproteobacteria bacterium]|nr:hypothetical protein [Gammaproteobacteria bacterium]
MNLVASTVFIYPHGPDGRIILLVTKNPAFLKSVMAFRTFPALENSPAPCPLAGRRIPDAREWPEFAATRNS